MKTFGGTTPQEKAMSRLLHDTANTLQDLNWKVELMGRWLKEHNDELRAKDPNFKSSSTPYVLIEYFKSRSKEVRTSIDEYTVKFQNDFPEQ